MFANQSRTLQQEATLWATSHGRIMSPLTVVCPRIPSYIRLVMLLRRGSFLEKNKWLRTQCRGRQHDHLIRHKFLSSLSSHLYFCLSKLEKQEKELVWQAYNLSYKLLHLFLVCSHLTSGKIYLLWKKFKTFHSDVQIQGRHDLCYERKRITKL